MSKSAKKAVKKTPTKKVVTKKSTSTSVKKKSSTVGAAKKVVKKAAATPKASAKKPTTVSAKKKTTSTGTKDATKHVKSKKSLVSEKNIPHAGLKSKTSISLNTPKTPINSNSMSESSKVNVRYSSDDLKEFEDIIKEKLETARKELQFIKELLSRKNDEGTDNTTGNLKMLEDGADVLEKESNSAMAARLQKFIVQLENALARIKNGTYGVCIVTGKLIPKERLRLVPHTQHSIEAKNQRL